jgi:hypothetical protein
MIAANHLKSENALTDTTFVAAIVELWHYVKYGG